VGYSQYISGLKELSETLRDKGVKVTIFYILYTSPAFRDYTEINTRVTMYNQGIDSLAALGNFDVLDLNEQLSKNGVLLQQYAMDDGLHLNESGYAIWGAELNKYLEQHK
ncbi:MAG: SGNH/GDSL hydrolase family protein, partial [Taibaiella sp.]|nr:SGNH/GDSL hydrolase family protein [Taibaiella sp.]